jgi:hypothetical protein
MLISSCSAKDKSPPVKNMSFIIRDFSAKSKNISGVLAS